MFSNNELLNKLLNLFTELGEKMTYFIYPLKQIDEQKWQFGHTKTVGLEK